MGAVCTYQVNILPSQLSSVRDSAVPNRREPKMPRKSKNKNSSSSITTSTAPFQREMRIPSNAIGLIIGKGGSNLNNFQQIPGISSVTCSCNGTFQIHAHSHQALETVATSIEELVSFALSKKNGYYPQYFAFCFCKSIPNPKLAVDKVCFERFTDDISNLIEQDRGTPFFALKSAQHSESDSMSVAEDEMEDLSADFANMTSKLIFHSHWDLSAYGAKLRLCLEPLIFSQHETTRCLKLAVRFGKLLFHGTSWNELQQGDFMSVRHLEDLCRRKHLKQRFSTACSDSALKDPSLFFHLQSLGYQKASSRKKFSIQVADLQCKKLQFNISVCFEGIESLGEKVSITRVRNQRKRHGFVTFCREGSARTDFRLGVLTHGTDLEADGEMVEWIDKAWRDRTPEGLLVFDPPGRFLVMNIRYMDALTFITEDWKLRIAQVRDGDRSNKFSNRWDCVLSSRWFKANVDKLVEDSMDSAMKNVEALVKEAAKLSPLLDAK